MQTEQQIISELYHAFNAGNPFPEIFTTISCKNQNASLIFNVAIGVANRKHNTGYNDYIGKGDGMSITDAIFFAIKDLIVVMSNVIDPKNNGTLTVKENDYVNKSLVGIKNILI
jgi:hypothetical protein